MIESPFLDELERDKIRTFVSDRTMFEAVKKVFLASVYQNGTLIAGKPAEHLKNFALALAFDRGVSNEQLGADLRACAEGVRMIEGAIRELEKLSEQPREATERTNKAL